MAHYTMLDPDTLQKGTEEAANILNSKAANNVAANAYEVATKMDDPRAATGWLSGLTGGRTEKEASIAQAEWANQFTAEQAELDRKFNSAQAELQRQFEKEMSNTAYKRAVKDMRNAGLNPALMYAKGGMSASTPSGAAASSTGAKHGTTPGAIPNYGSAFAMMVGSAVAAGVTAGGKLGAAKIASKSKMDLYKASMPSWW